MTMTNPDPHRQDSAANPDDGSTSRAPMVVAGTFTLEPAQRALALWSELLGFPLEVVFAPYQQVFQQLLDPSSDFATNDAGANLLFLRYVDYLRDLPSETPHEAKRAHLDKTLSELAAALQAFADRSAAPLIVVEAPAVEELDESAGIPPIDDLADSFRERTSGHARIQWLTLDAGTLGGEDAFDREQDRLAHIPYSELAYAHLSARAMRRLHAVRVAPRKVLVLDCDNTIWGGVVGEDGVQGIDLAPGYAALQRWAVDLVDQGVLVALCSKNADADVAAALAQRDEFPLRSEHIVARRVNWSPKVQNLQELAVELNLGLDSFVFLDDNPVECGQVRALLPQVMTLQVPAPEQLEAWLAQLWVFDRVTVTEEDRARTAMYRQNAERKQFEASAGSLESFLSSLELKVDSAAPAPEEMARLSQLTQRTNQFNASTVRRSVEEVEALRDAGGALLRQRVQDRFGDYGVVGALFLCPHPDEVEVDTFLLSCRVLGRGVEHAMLRAAAEFAVERGAVRLSVPFIGTAKNEPMRAFLANIPDSQSEPIAGGVRYTWNARRLATLQHRPGEDPKAVVEAAKGKRQVAAGRPATRTSGAYGEIAQLLAEPQTLQEHIARAGQRVRALSEPLVPPAGETEAALCQLWQELLGIDAVGARDDYFDLGGTSLMAVPLFAAIERRWGVKLALTVILSARNVRDLAQLIAGDRGEAPGATILLRPGNDREPALFLVHDGDGEVLLYRNLAQRVRPGMAVHGIPPHEDHGLPIAQASVEAMARHYLGVVRAVQPEGPYYLGGMCAGGTLSVEIARQLEMQGHEVGAVFVMDAAAPGAVERRGVVTKQRWQRFAELFQGAGGTAAGAVIGQAAAKVASAASYEALHRTQAVRERSLFTLLKALLMRGQRWPSTMPRWSVRQIYDLAAEAHAPTPLRQSPVIVIRARSGDGDDIGYRHLYGDEDLGWGRVCRGPLKIVDVEGGHASMLQEPFVDTLAERVNTQLEGHKESSKAIRPPSLLVIIVNYRAGALVCECLDSLEQEVRQRGHTQVAVVDNPGGTDDATLIARHVADRGYDFCEVLPQERNGGFAYGNNAAIRRAEASGEPPDYYLLLNPDTVVKPGALSALLDHMQHHPQVGIAGSRLLEPDGTVANSVFRFPTIASELDDGMRTGPISRLLKDHVVAQPIPDGIATTDWLSGASFMVRRAALEETGLMDEAYFLYYEEVDLCFRAHELGWQCAYVPTSEVVHLEGQSTGVSDPKLQRKRLPAYCHESRARFFRKNYGPAYAAATDVVWVSAHILYRLREAVRGRAPETREAEATDRIRYAVKGLLSR